MRQVNSVLLAALAVVVCLAASVAAQEQQVTKLTLHSQMEPKPALRYRLLPGFIDQVPGNAAVPYGKVTAEEWTFFGKQEWRDKVERWMEVPLEELKRETVTLPSSSIFFLEQGARSKYCDWQLPFGRTPFYTILLPDAQQSRGYARILAVKARREIAEGRFDEAVKTFQTSYALGRHIAEGETLVNGLIGIAICGTTSTQVLEFVQQPDAPNLYSALTMLPTPLVGMNKALEVEEYGVELSFPELRDLENNRRTPDEWRDLFHHVAVKLFEWSGDAETKVPTPSTEQLDELCRQSLPIIKRELMLHGTPPEMVDAMSLHQAALLHTISLYHELIGDGMKWYSLPFPQAMAEIRAARARAERAKQDRGEIIPIGAQLFPALEATRRAVARNDRQIAALRVIEALRIYGASHDGKLPERLADITEAPIPEDPVTGKPFIFQKEGDKALLEGPGMDDPARPVLQVPLKYEISMVR
jgi:hypothetical protein